MLDWTESNGWTFIHLQGELDMSNANSFKEELIEGMISNSKVNIALDFSKLEYIDSSGLGVVVSLHKRCKINGGRLAIYGVNETLTRLFKLTSLDKALNIYKDQSDLLKNG